MLPSPAMDASDKPGDLLRQFLALTKDNQQLQHEIKVTPWTEGADVPSSTSLLVPCIAASRVGSDVSAAYSNLSVPGDFSMYLSFFNAQHNFVNHILCYGAPYKMNSA